ncbi:MAG: hypothetical protein B1H03_06725, partial [Planctomycetales bacterium 4484_113]
MYGFAPTGDLNPPSSGFVDMRTCQDAIRKSKPIHRGCIMKRTIRLGRILGAILAAVAIIVLAASCRGGDNSWWDPWAGSKYLADAGDITTDPDPVIANQLTHITITFNTTVYTELVSKQSVLDLDTRTLTITAYARERDGQKGTWDGTLGVATTFPEPGIWHIAIPQEGDRVVGADIYVQPQEGAPVEKVWAGDPYFPDTGDVTTDPDPLTVNKFSHITISFLKTDSTELISQESTLDADSRSLTVTVVARELLNQSGTWDGSVVVPVTFLDAGVWHIVIPQEQGTQTQVDVFVQPEEGAPQPVLWAGDSYLPDAGDVVTSPDPLQVNTLAHITINFNKTEFTDIISQESSLDQASRTLTVTVYARERDNQQGGWDGTVVIPVTFLERGVWHLLIPQEGDRTVSVDLYVYPEEDAWAGDSYIPNAGDVTITPDPAVVNQLTHITVNFNITNYTELMGQQSVL